MSISAKSIEYILLICAEQHPVIAVASTIFDCGALAPLPEKMLLICPLSVPPTPLLVPILAVLEVYSRSTQQSTSRLSMPDYKSRGNDIPLSSSRLSSSSSSLSAASRACSSSNSKSLGSLSSACTSRHCCCASRVTAQALSAAEGLPQPLKQPLLSF